jgi:hypothetical protein
MHKKAPVYHALLIYLTTVIQLYPFALLKILVTVDATVVKKLGNSVTWPDIMWPVSWRSWLLFSA